MKKILITVFLIIVFNHNIFSDQIITDMAGRSITLKDSNEIRAIFTANPISSIFLYTVDSSLLVGWNTKLSSDAKKVLNKEVLKLKNYGVLYGNGKSANDEEIIKNNPDFILLMGEESEAIALKADQLTKRLGIPVVVLYSDLGSSIEAYKIIGRICGLEDRCESLAEYTNKVISRAERITQSIKTEDKKKVYYSLETTGLKTYPAGSSNTTLIELCGGENVISLPKNSKFGTMTISFEELLIHKPDLILAGSFPNREMRDGTVFDQKHWEILNAEVSVIPRNPFNIFEKPPSVNRVAGIIWLQNELYPDLVDYNSQKELLKFQDLFYGIN